jgi:hypothetical protein
MSFVGSNQAEGISADSAEEVKECGKRCRSNACRENVYKGRCPGATSKTCVSAHPHSSGEDKDLAARILRGEGIPVGWLPPQAEVDSRGARW